MYNIELVGYKTPDGKVFETMSEAEAHLNDLRINYLWEKVARYAYRDLETFIKFINDNEIAIKEYYKIKNDTN